MILPSQLPFHSANVQSQKSQSLSSSIPASYHAFLFTIADYTFALPVGVVERVLQWKVPLNCQMQRHSAIQIGDRPTNILNLYPLVTREAAQANQAKSVKSTDILLWLRSTGLQSYVLMCDRPPIMVDLKLKTFHPIPLVYHSTLGLISHQMIVLTQAEVNPSGDSIHYRPNVEQLSEIGRLEGERLEGERLEGEASKMTAQIHVFLLDLKAVQCHGM